MVRMCVAWVVEAFAVYLADADVEVGGWNSGLTAGSMEMQT
jgi:hypothetical protein